MKLPHTLNLGRSRAALMAIAVAGVVPFFPASAAFGAGLPGAKSVAVAVVVVPAVLTPAVASGQSPNAPPTGGTLSAPTSTAVIAPVVFTGVTTYSAPAAPPPAS